jgi:hypothetical protein
MSQITKHNNLQPKHPVAGMTAIEDAGGGQRARNRSRGEATCSLFNLFLVPLDDRELYLSTEMQADPEKERMELVLYLGGRDGASRHMVAALLPARRPQLVVKVS